MTTGQILKGPGFGTGVLVAGAAFAWVLVMACMAWLVFIKEPHTRAVFAEAQVALPAVTEFAMRCTDWVRANWQLSMAGALVPLLVLFLVRKAVVALGALALTFFAGMVLGALLMALWLPELKVREQAALHPAVEPATP